MTLATIKQDIIKQYKNLVSKAILKALEIIFSPCCEETITSVSYDCGTEELTLSISPAIPSIGQNGGFSEVFAEGGYHNFGVISADGTTITVSSVALVDVIGITSYYAAIFLPTALDNENSGAYIFASGLVIPVGPCE
jgi:hypothetical protein